MKRTVLTILAFILVFTLCACNGDGSSSNISSGITPNTISSTPSTTTQNDAPVGESTPMGTSIPQVTTPMPDDEFTLTLYAVFLGDDRLHETVPLPIVNESASPSLITFYLAEELSKWTGYDFTLNDVRFGEDSVTVDWSKDSTLIAGSDNMNQKEDFHFLDVVSLNWFMMDSLAMTLKNNLNIMKVYYCSDGGPVTFTNPEDMAEQGLPELPVDQSYEGSAFFMAHADGRGDLIPIDKYQALEIVKESEVTQKTVQWIEANGGNADYVYIGEGVVEDRKAWFFDIGDTDEYCYAVDECGELWGLDLFGKWWRLPILPEE